MNKLLLLLLLAILSVNVFAQSDLENLVAAEKLFARTALEKNTKDAFLEFLADDGIVFEPTPMNGKDVWKNRTENEFHFSWSPIFADISTNGILGYTVGPWELRMNSKTATPTAFGHYVSLWQKQSDGKFKVILDIGINHEKVPLDLNWKVTNVVNKEFNEKKISAADSSTQFFETAEKVSLEKAYKLMASDDIKLFREGKLPIIGKKAALNEIKNVKTRIKFGRRSIFTSAGDLAYISNSYQYLDKQLKEVEKGNYLLIWKFQKGKWQIVLDLFAPLPK